MNEEERLDLLTEIRDAIKDEEEAVPMYNKMARAADRLGLVAEGDIFREIRTDEAKHGSLLRSMLSRLVWPIKPEQEPLSRLYPETYGDWADLGSDIKAKDPSLSKDIDSNLTLIYEGSSDQDSAKKWLILKAGELGIT